MKNGQWYEYCLLWIETLMTLLLSRLHINRDHYCPYLYTHNHFFLSVWDTICNQQFFLQTKVTHWAFPHPSTPNCLVFSKLKQSHQTEHRIVECTFVSTTQHTLNLSSPQTNIYFSYKPTRLDNGSTTSIQIHLIW